MVGDLDDLLDWFRETELQLKEAEPPSSDPEVIRVQLKEHKVLGEEISSQKGRVRDILSAAKKVLREGAQSEDSGIIREKMDDLKVRFIIIHIMQSNLRSIFPIFLPSHHQLFKLLKYY